MTKDKRIIDFFSEAGLLKLIKRSGWWVLGIKNPESVAEHSFRCAIIGYALAKMEKADSDKVLKMSLFNDLQEARINDSHKMAQRYIDYQKAEDAAFNEQISSLPRSMKDELSSLHKEYRNQRTKESIVARDADILECLIQAKEYYGHGFKEANKFMRKAPLHLVSKSAKRLWRIAKSSDINNWWFGLSTFRR